jgi:hypothetical protein
MEIILNLASSKQKGSFRRNGLTSNDCLPYEKSLNNNCCAENSAYFLSVLVRL